MYLRGGIYGLFKPGFNKGGRRVTQISSSKSEVLQALENTRRYLSKLTHQPSSTMRIIFQWLDHREKSKRTKYKVQRRQNVEHRPKMKFFFFLASFRGAHHGF